MPPGLGFISSPHREKGHGGGDDQREGAGFRPWADAEPHFLIASPISWIGVALESGKCYTGLSLVLGSLLCDKQAGDILVRTLCDFGSR